jgi:hypothetical protein
MFIRLRIEPDLYINTDHLASVEYGIKLAAQDAIKPIGCRLRMVDGSEHCVTEAAAGLLMELLDANSGYTGEIDSEAVTAPLASLIAQTLRDTFRGLTNAELLIVVRTKANHDDTTDAQLADALALLQKENVIVELNGGRWYHATSAEVQTWRRQEREKIAATAPATPCPDPVLDTYGEDKCIRCDQPTELEPGTYNRIHRRSIATPSPDPSSAAAAP